MRSRILQRVTQVTVAYIALLVLFTPDPAVRDEALPVFVSLTTFLWLYGSLSWLIRPEAMERARGLEFESLGASRWWREETIRMLVSALVLSVGWKFGDLPRLWATLVVVSLSLAAFFIPNWLFAAMPSVPQVKPPRRAISEDTQRRSASALAAGRFAAKLGAASAPITIGAWLYSFRGVYGVGA